MISRVWNVFVLFYCRRGRATVGRFGVTSSKTAWLLGREPPAHKCKSEWKQEQRDSDSWVNGRWDVMRIGRDQLPGVHRTLFLATR